MRFALVAAVAALSLAAPAARAQEIGLSGGRTAVSGDDDGSYAWSIDFSQSLTRHWAWSISHLNEGHLDGHHRDGFAAQAWLKLPLFDDRLWLAVGGGVYRHYDTQRGADGASENVHGAAPIYGFAANYYLGGPWSARLSVQHVPTDGWRDTTVVLAGIGLRLGAHSWSALPRPGRRMPGPETGPARQELDLFVGSTTVNTFGSEKARARGIEFRHDVGRYAEWSITMLNEGSNELIRRNGLASQFWVVRPARDGALRLGLGAGLYGNLDKRRLQADGETEGRRGLAGIVGITAAVRLSGPWLARVTWTRIVTDYHRDADVYTLGAGVRF